jgi:hypothetical protein
MDLGGRGFRVGANTGGVPKFAIGFAAYIHNLLFHHFEEEDKL